MQGVACGNLDIGFNCYVTTMLLDGVCAEKRAVVNWLNAQNWRFNGYRIEGFQPWPLLS